MDITVPPFEVEEQAVQHLLLVLKEQDDALKVLRLHLFTEYFLNEILIAYLRTDQKGLQRAGLRYGQKVTLTEISRILEKDCCDLLRKLNSLRQKVAHELEYQVSTADKKALTEGIASAIDDVSEENVFVRLAQFLTGYLSGGVKLAKLAAKTLSGG